MNKTINMDVQSKESTMNVQNQENSLASSKLIERIEVKGTPFHITCFNQGPDSKWAIAIGNKIVTEFKNSKEEVNKLINKNINWQLLTSLIVVVCENVVNEKLRIK